MPAPSHPFAQDNRSAPLQLSTHSTHQGHPDPTNIFDYTQKYPADKEGRELDHDSRTWKVYIDEHESYDFDMVKGFRDNIDTLLVFAALFSSIVTGFVVPAAERLEPDNAQINTSILFEATQLLRANGNATLIEATPRSELRPNSVTHSTADVCVAWMFFASLALSLATALISILAKQWLQAFTALVPGDAKRQSLTRQFRFAGMQRWKFSENVGFLPLLLHLSLFLFLVGLCVFVEPYHWSFLTMVGFVSLAALVFYVVTAALPAVYVDCPYRIPILFIPASACIYARRALRFQAAVIWPSIRKLRKSFTLTSGRQQTPTPSLSTGHESSRRSPPTQNSRPSFVSSSLSTQERKYIESNTQSLEWMSLEWLYTQTTNTSVQRIALYGLARVLEKYVCCHPAGADPLLPPSYSTLDNMQSFARAILDNVSGSKYVGDDIPQLLDFHIHSSHALRRESIFSGSDWPSLIQSPHLESFVDRKLLPLGVEFSAQGTTGYPLHIACSADRWDIVQKYLREFPSQWTKADSQGWLPAGRAALSNKVSIQLLKDILNFLPFFKPFSRVGELPVNSNGDTLLHVLCEHGADMTKIKSVEYVWDGFLDIQRRDGRTPLHLLSVSFRNPSHNVEIAKFLLSKGANIGVVDSSQLTPLHVACMSGGSSEMVEALCSHLQTVEDGNHVINCRGYDGRTALHHACYFGLLPSESVQTLISAGADFYSVDNKKNLPLHMACHQRPSSCLDIIRILLDNMKDNINLQNEDQGTPLDVLVGKSDLLGLPLPKDRQEAYELMRKKGAKRARELNLVANGGHDGSKERVDG